MLLFGSIAGYADEDSFVPTDTLETNLDRFLSSKINNTGPGIAMAVVRGGTEIYHKSYGLAVLETNTPVRASTPFYLASVGKQFTSMAVMILAEKGLLDYQDPITRFFPDAPASWKPITIHHLLTHQSGLADFFGPLRSDIDGITNPQVFRWIVQRGGPDFKPGTKAEYGNTGYVLLALLVEQVSGMPIEEFMQVNLFAPAGMHHTFVVNEDNDPSAGRALGYNASGVLDDYRARTVGSGGIYSTVDDMKKWSAAIDDNLFVSSGTFGNALEPHVERLYEDYDYGYGWVLSENNGDKVISHTGGNRNFTTLLAKVPVRGLTIVMVSNGGYSWLRSLSDRIIAHIYSVPEE